MNFVRKQILCSHNHSFICAPIGKLISIIHGHNTPPYDFLAIKKVQIISLLHFQIPLGVECSGISIAAQFETIKIVYKHIKNEI